MNITPEVKDFLLSHTRKEIELVALHLHLQQNDYRQDKTAESYGVHVNTVRRIMEKNTLPTIMVCNDNCGDNRN